MGTPVYAFDGERLGVVIQADPYQMIVEQGWFFVHDYEVHLSDVDCYEDGMLFLRLTKAQVVDANTVD